MHKRMILIAIIVLVVSPHFDAAYACSAWSAVGDKAAGGKSLLAKNWDFGDNNYAEFRVSKQRGKYAFLIKSARAPAGAPIIY